MKYDYKTNEADAIQAAKTYRDKGFASYYLMLAFNNYQVRYWR